MRRAVVLGTGFVAICAVLLPAQEDGKTTHESVLKELISVLDKLTGVLGTVKDEPSAKAAVPEVKKVLGRLEEVNKKAKALPQPDKEEKDRIAKLYRPKLEEAIKKQREEVTRVKAIPGGSELVQLIKPPERKSK